MKILIMSCCYEAHRLSQECLCTKCSPAILAKASNDSELENIKRLTVQAMKAVGLCSDKAERLWCKFTSEPTFNLIYGDGFNDRIEHIADQFVSRSKCTLCFSSVVNPREIIMYTIDTICED